MKEHNIPLGGSGGGQKGADAENLLASPYSSLRLIRSYKEPSRAGLPRNPQGALLPELQPPTAGIRAAVPEGVLGCQESLPASSL